MFDLFSFVSKEIIPGATTPTFQEVGLQIFFWFQYKQHKVCLVQNINAGHV